MTTLLHGDRSCRACFEGTTTDESLRPLASTWCASCKVALDFTLSLLLLVLAGPLIVAAALLVKLTSPGPAIYSQTRLGRHGRPFTIYKIRTMSHNCEGLTGPRWS